jgi:hypothetical protein
MPRTIDLRRLKATTVAGIDESKKRIDDAIQAKLHYFLLRWMCQMTAVEVHQTWERYVEMRLIAALNHDPRHFLAAQNIKGVSRVSYGLATYIIRGGNRYFDFRSMGELIDKARRGLPSICLGRCLRLNENTSMRLLQFAIAWSTEATPQCERIEEASVRSTASNRLPSQPSFSMQRTFETPVLPDIRYDFTD